MNVVYVAVPSQLPNEIEAQLPQVLLACRACLDTENTLYDLHQLQLSQLFGEFTGIPVFPADGYPQCICSVCLHQLRKFYSFRIRCHSAMYLLQQARMCNGEISTDIIKSIDRTHVKLNLTTTETQYLEVKTHEDKETNTDELNPDGCEEPIAEETQTDGDILGNDVNEFIDDGNGNSVTEDAPKKRVKRGYVLRKERGYKKTYKGPSDDLNVSEGECDDVVIDEMWETIMNEIDEENSRSVVIRRRKIFKDDIKYMIKRATKFSNMYNVEVKFLTVAEQLRERDEKRNEESFQTAAYKCEDCVKVFPTEATYDRHAPNHSPEMGDYYCEICKYRFYTILMYRKHFSAIHTKKFICKECGVVTRFWSEARSHAKFHDGNRIHCEHCEMNFTGRKLYMSHLRSKHNAGVALCSLCGGLFMGPVGLKVHTDKVHKNTVKCPHYCLRAYINEEALQNHLELTNNGECSAAQSYCSTCGDSFQSESEFQDHFNESHKTGLKCHQCYIYFTDPEVYSSHMENHLTLASGARETQKNNRKKKKLEKEKKKAAKKCGLCGSDEKCDHKPHPKMRAERKQQKCKICNKIFYRPLSFQKHMASHENAPKKFICEVCGTEKQSLAHLTYHRRQHSGEKPYQCDYCLKSFTLKKTLKVHITTHTGTKPYKCTICKKRFAHPADLKAHMLTHSKERPYACDICDKRYRCETSLREHMDSVHRSLPHRRGGKRTASKGSSGK